MLVETLFTLALVAPKKPWTPEMCRVVQRAPVSRAYVLYCERVSPSAYPACKLSDPEGMMAAARGGHGAYLEVLDCSWHSGRNPRTNPRLNITP